MYAIKVDGRVMYSPVLDSVEYQVLDPRLQLEVNKAGSLSFVLPPGNAMHDEIHRMKSIITVELDDDEVFRGRVTEERTDIYNQTEYYCEGELSFLLDSIHRPFTFSGTAEEFFRQMIAGHNEQVEEEKRFTVGMVTAVDENDRLEFQNYAYADTSGEIGIMLLKEFGGYLRVRLEDGMRYIDYLEALDDQCGQAIEFGVNLLDLDKQIEAKNIFTVLIPLGNIEGSRDPLTIETVNDGKDYLESAEGVAKYGRIVKTHTWDNITDPSKLLELGQEKLDNAAVSDSITLCAVDLRMAGVDVDRLWLGHMIRMVSKPHGLDREDACMAIDIDLQNPENNKYTFGTPPGTLSDGVNEHSQLLQSHSSRIRETESAIMINLEHVNEMEGRVSTVEVDLDAAKSAILLKADTSLVTEQGQRISSAELAIDGLNSQITLKADKIDLQGYVTVDELEAKVITVVGTATSYFESLNAGHIGCDSIGANGSIVCEDLNTYSLSTSTLQVGSGSYDESTATVVQKLQGVSLQTKTLHFFDVNGDLQSVQVVTNVSLNDPLYTTINYLGGASE